jgi:hypothetical protein
MFGTATNAFQENEGIIPFLVIVVQKDGHAKIKRSSGLSSCG